MTNEREAIIINADTETPVIDLDPINLTVEVEMVMAGYRLADGTDERLESIVDTMEEYVIQAEDAGTTLNLALVWSDTRKNVKASCIECEGPFDVNDMMISDGGMTCVTCFEAGE